MEALSELLQPQLQASPALRKVLRLVGELLIAEANRAEQSLSGPETGSALAVDNSVELKKAALPPTPREHVETVPLQIGDAAMPVVVTGSMDEIKRARLAASESSTRRAEVDGSRESFLDLAEIDLAQMERRCRLKAESCRSFAELRQAGLRTPEYQSGLQRRTELIELAKTMQPCFLWVYIPGASNPDDESLETIAGCYEALADAAALIRRLCDPESKARREQMESAMSLMAEANSALRVALESTWLTKPDIDQDQAHLWLRRETQEQRVFIARHMKVDDPADPYQHHDVRQRTAALVAELDAAAARAREISKLEKLIQYHAKMINGKGVSDHDLRKIGDAATALVLEGVAPTDRRWANLLPISALEVLASRDDLPSALRSAVLAIQSRREANEQVAERSTQETRKSYSAQVAQVRLLLEGKSLVMIGGEPYPEAMGRIAEAFGLEEVLWPEITEHGTSEPMRGPIFRPGVAMVCVLVKLAGHLHAANAREFARSADKPCLMLTGGYNPEQIAQAALDQASQRLANNDE